MKVNFIIEGDVRKKLKDLPGESVQCIVTSPPYYGLRDYGNDCQIGMEETPEKYIQTMLSVFSECRRVLKNDGVLWLNIGDTYASGKIGRDDVDAAGRERLSKYGNNGYANKDINTVTPVKLRKPPIGLKSKDLIGIPWLLAFGLRSDGWYLRQDIIWSKPNPMPESVTDRCTRSHEYIFMLSKSSKYYYDHESIRTDAKISSVKRWNQDIENKKGSERVLGKSNGAMKAVGGKQRGHSRRHAGFNERWDLMTTEEQMSLGANKRSVWNVATMPFSEAHFATFPEELIVDCIKAGCPENGIVLDPFMGAGTTALVARKLNRNFIGIELNPDYIKIAEKRLKKELGMFL